MGRSKSPASPVRLSDLGYAAIDEDLTGRDEAAIVGGEEGDDLRNLLISSVRHAVPPVELVHQGYRCHRRKQVQSGQQPGQKFYHGQSRKTHSAQVEASIARYLDALERADLEDSDVAEAKTSRLKEKIEGLKRQMHYSKRCKSR
jgi:hypothetical protein